MGWEEMAMSASTRSLRQRVFPALKEGLMITLYLWAVFGLPVTSIAMHGGYDISAGS
jgi:hypothetical protein